MSTKPHITKRIFPAPGSTNRVRWDWTRWATALGVTITSFEVTADSGVGIGSVTLSGNVVTAYLTVPLTELAVKALCKVVASDGSITSRYIIMVPTAQ